MEVIELTKNVRVQVVAQNPRIMRERQTVIYVNVMRVWGRKHTVNDLDIETIRVTIHANAYRDQSFGCVERWDGSQWHRVVYIPGANLKMDPTCLYVVSGHDDQFIGEFTPDFRELLRYVKEVL